MSTKSIILIEDIISSESDTESVAGSAATDVVSSLFPFVVPEEKVVFERGEESLVGSL